MDFGTQVNIRIQFNKHVHKAVELLCFKCFELISRLFCLVSINNPSLIALVKEITDASQTCKELYDLYSNSVWTNRLSKKFGPDWVNLSEQLVGKKTENLDLSEIYNQLIIQCPSKIKNCEVCDNWSILKGDSDQENAHWAGENLTVR